LARGTLTVLDKEEVERIHAASIRILEKIGVAIHSDSVRHLVERAGCTPSADFSRTLIPEEVVKSALSRAPKSILLASRDRKHDLLIPSSDRTFMSNGGEGIYVKNLLTGKTHTSGTKDTIDFTVLAEKIPQVDFLWTMVGAIDQPVFIKELVELKVCFENTNKHFMGGALSAEQAKDMIEMLAVLSGGRKELERRPICSGVQCPIPPLSFDKGLVEAQVEFARAKLPVCAMSAPIAGIASPITLAGTLAQTNAENLASLVISQAACKGAPFIYSSDSSPADMRTGSIDYGGVESPLLHAGCGQMGRHYGLPTMVSGATIEEASMSLGNAQEGIKLMLAEALLPSDLGSGFGGIDNALGASLEQFVVDTWVWDLTREFVRTFETDEDAISLETIRQTAQSGSYLTQPHTIRRFRKEVISASRPELAPEKRDEIRPRGSLVKKARKEAERLLKEPRGQFLSKGEAKELEALMARFRKERKAID
jgi:trimethylamine--corrinoid protein Co-methyltransferase